MDGSDVGPTLNCRLSERFNRLSDFFVFTDVHWILIYGQVLLLRHPWMVVMLVLLLTADSVNGLIGYLTFCIYRCPLDIDLWTGALTETPMDGSDVGPTLNCRLSEQFNRLSDFLYLQMSTGY